MYTGKHLEGRVRITHTKTRQYYQISHPLEKNVRTGNACVNKREVLKFDKDFIFQYLDEYNALKTVLVPKRIVVDNMFPLLHTEKDDEGNIIRRHLVYLIKIATIFDKGYDIEL